MQEHSFVNVGEHTHPASVTGMTIQAESSTGALGHYRYKFLHFESGLAEESGYSRFLVFGSRRPANLLKRTIDL